MNIINWLDDPQLLASWYPGDTWRAQRVGFKASYGLPMDAAELALFTELSGRQRAPTERAREVWWIGGRRINKTKGAATLVVHEATRQDWRQRLSRGERAVAMLLAADKTQARIALSYVRSMLLEVPLLRPMVERETAHTLSLTNGVDVMIVTSNYRAVRGFTSCIIVADELCFWPEDGVNSAADTIAALRPTLGTTGGLFVAISSPRRRSGPMYANYRAHWGKDDDPILVLKGASLTWNPALDAAMVAAAYEEDPAAATSEWGGDFRADLEDYISREVVEGCVIPLRHELPPLNDVTYVAGVDPSGGASDAMTCAIAHTERANGTERIVLDACREVRPPFSPAAVVEEFTHLLHQYRIHRVVGDRYGGEFVREPFRARGIQYDLADQTCSDYFKNLLPILMNGTVDLLDNRQLVAQCISLERHVSRSGRDVISHPPNGHDDLVNACAIALVEAGKHRQTAGTMRLTGW